MKFNKLMTLFIGTACLSTGGSAHAGLISELFFSEYVEGSSNNKALEIFNGTGAAVDLTEYLVQIFFNGNNMPGLSIPLNGVIADGDVFVLVPGTADPLLFSEADQVHSGGSWFNGDDAVVLEKSGTPIDVIGQIGFDPGSEWSSSGIGTQNETLRRKSSVIAGDPNGSNPFDPSAEWDTFPQDSFDGVGTHSVVLPFVVASSLPSDGAVVNSLLTDFILNLNSPVDASSLDAGDLLVNGVEADGYSIATGNQTVSFSFAASPALWGVNTIQVSAAAFADSRGTGLSAFNAIFTAREPGPSVPEPATLTLFSLGLAGLGLQFRKRAA